MPGVPERDHGQQRGCEHEHDKSEHGVLPAKWMRSMDVLAMQFAGFMSIAHLVPHWDCEWVEYAISAGEGSRGGTQG